MASTGWDLQRARQEMARLTAPGLLGFYTHLEATEVFAVPAGQSAALNVFSIVVAEERHDVTAEEARYLSAPIHLKSLKRWTFGIKRYVKPIAELLPLFARLGEPGEWRPSGDILSIGNVAPVATQFVPPDQTGTVPWNRVLKNNFWNGSHVLEWMDLKKEANITRRRSDVRFVPISEVEGLRAAASLLSRFHLCMPQIRPVIRTQ